MNLLLAILSFIRASVTVSHFLLVSSFISSRPPGRKMVTADINLYAHFFCDLGIFVMSLEAFFFSIFGPLPSILIFIFLQMFVTSITLWMGVVNVSSLIQVAIITNQWWISEMTDTNIILCAKIGILFHCFNNIYENVLILSGYLPFLTRGPFAVFFGGEKILSELSKTSPSRHTQYLCMASIIFNLSIQVFKKYHSRKVSRYGKLKEMLADNFLNLMTVTSIILCSTMMTLMLMYHYRTADKNKESSSSTNVRMNAIRSILFQTLFESCAQFYCFFTNPALRYYSNKKIRQLLRETLLSLSSHMKSFLAKLEHWNIEMAKSKSSTAGSKSKDQKNQRGRSSKFYQKDNRNQRRLPEVQI